MDGVKVEKFEWLIQEVIRYGIKIGIALLIIIGGLWLGSKLKNIIRKRMIARGVEPSIREFLIPILDIVFKILIILTAINTVGIQITSFAAIMAGLAAGIGLSLQGSLSNFAGGILIILYKPFKVGDYIEALGHGGTVESISILYTTIVTPNQQVVVLPNSSLLNSPIMNYSVMPNRRLDIKVGISYSDDIEKTQEVLKKMLQDDPLILKNQPITVEVLNFGDSSVNLAVRAFVKRENYWDAYFKLHKKTKLTLDSNGISIPFPQTELRIVPSDNENLKK